MGDYISGVTYCNKNGIKQQDPKYLSIVMWLNLITPQAKFSRVFN